MTTDNASSNKKMIAIMSSNVILIKHDYHEINVQFIRLTILFILLGFDIELVNSFLY